MQIFSILIETIYLLGELSGQTRLMDLVNIHVLHKNIFFLMVEKHVEWLVTLTTLISIDLLYLMLIFE